MTYAETQGELGVTMIFMIRFYTIRQRKVQEVLLSQPRS